MSSTVVLVDMNRARAAPLVRYLVEVGFSVRHIETDTPGGGAEDAMVWLIGGQADDRAIVDIVRIWLGTRDARALVVCERAAHLHGLSGDARIWFLPAPIYGWQLVKTLRDASPLFCPRNRSLHRRRRRRPRS